MSASAAGSAPGASASSAAVNRPAQPDNSAMLGEATTSTSGSRDLAQTTQHDTDGIQFDETMHDLPLALQLKQAQSQPTGVSPAVTTADTAVAPGPSRSTTAPAVSSAAPLPPQSYAPFVPTTTAMSMASLPGAMSLAPATMQQYQYAGQHHYRPGPPPSSMPLNGIGGSSQPYSMPSPYSAAPLPANVLTGVPMPPLVKQEGADSNAPEVPVKRKRGRPRKIPGTESRPPAAPRPASSQPRPRGRRPGRPRKRSRADSDEEDIDLSSDSASAPDDNRSERERDMREEQPDDFDPSGATGGPTTKFGRKVSKPKAFVPGSGDKVKTRKRKPKEPALEATITCDVCHEGQSPPAHNRLVICDSCLHGWHQLCHVPVITDQQVDAPEPWFCYNCSRKLQQMRPKVNVLEGQWAVGPTSSNAVDSRNAPAWPRELKQAWLQRLPLASFVDYLLSIETKYAAQLGMPGLAIWPSDLAHAIERLKEQDAKEAEEREKRDAAREAARQEGSSQAATESPEPSRDGLARTMADRRAAQQQQQQQQQQASPQAQMQRPPSSVTFPPPGQHQFTGNVPSPLMPQRSSFSNMPPIPGMQPQQHSQQPNRMPPSLAQRPAGAPGPQGHSPRTPQSPFGNPSMPQPQPVSRSSSVSSNRSPQLPHQGPPPQPAGPAGAPNAFGNVNRPSPGPYSPQVGRNNSASSQGSQASDPRVQQHQQQQQQQSQTRPQVPAYMRAFEPVPALQPHMYQGYPNGSGGPSMMHPQSRAPSGPDAYAPISSMIGPSGMPSAAGAFSSPAPGPGGPSGQTSNGPGYYGPPPTSSSSSSSRAPYAYSAPIPPTQYSGRPTPTPPTSSFTMPSSSGNGSAQSPRMPDYASPRMHQNNQFGPPSMQMPTGPGPQHQHGPPPSSLPSLMGPNGFSPDVLPPLPQQYPHQAHPQQQQHHQRLFDVGSGNAGAAGAAGMSLQQHPDLQGILSGLGTNFGKANSPS